jgi:WD40 repeat protein
LLPYGEPIMGVQEGDMFGSSVSISDDGQILAVGSPAATTNLGYAVVFAFDVVTSLWVQLGETISLSEPDGFAGSAVSISGNGNRVAVGAPRANSNDGVTLIFQYNSLMKVWSRLGQRIVGVEGELNGYSLSLNSIGDTVAIGAVRFESSQDLTGRVYVYKLEGSDWSLLGSSIAGNDLMGRSVSLSSDGTRLAIGSTGFDSDDLVDIGACEVYGFVGGWVKFGSTLRGEEEDERSGFSVSLSRNGQRVACGGPGNSVVRLYEEGDGDWRLIGLPVSGPSGTEFGAAVTVNADGNVLAIGAPAASVGGEVNVGTVQLLLLSK